MIPLPPTAQVVADIIGRSATLLLASKCQYRHFYIPRQQLSASHWIVRTIGPRKASALQSVFGGELIPLANCYHVHQAERDAQIRAAARAGDPIHVIASRFKLSPGHIKRLLNKDQVERNRQQARERARRNREDVSIDTRQPA